LTSSTAGVRDFDFYTMNRADLVYAIYAICHLLRPAADRGASSGVRPEDSDDI
jgi:hypothetical protein